MWEPTRRNNRQQSETPISSSPILNARSRASVLIRTADQERARDRRSNGRREVGTLKLCLVQSCRKAASCISCSKANRRRLHRAYRDASRSAPRAARKKAAATRARTILKTIDCMAVGLVNQIARTITRITNRTPNKNITIRSTSMCSTLFRCLLYNFCNLVRAPHECHLGSSPGSSYMPRAVTCLSSTDIPHR
jgi:hypothetical protein